MVAVTLAGVFAGVMVLAAFFAASRQAFVSLAVCMRWRRWLELIQPQGAGILISEGGFIGDVFRSGEEIFPGDRVADWLVALVLGCDGVA